MTTITLEVPDALAARISAMSDRLPELLSGMLDPIPEETSQALRAAATHHVYREMLDFLASSPTPQQIVDFKLPKDDQERLEELLEKNREERLSDVELAELDVYELVHHSVIRLKAQARRAQF
jgi:hypothetical protein